MNLPVAADCASRSLWKEACEDKLFEEEEDGMLSLAMDAFVTLNPKPVSPIALHSGVDGCFCMSNALTPPWLRKGANAPAGGSLYHGCFLKYISLRPKPQTPNPKDMNVGSPCQVDHPPEEPPCECCSVGRTPTGGESVLSRYASSFGARGEGFRVKGLGLRDDLNLKPLNPLKPSTLNPTETFFSPYTLSRSS